MANVLVDLTGANRSVSVMDSLARTATPNTIQMANAQRLVGLILVVDVTAVVTTPSITVVINGVDPFSGKTWPVLTSAAITAVGTTVLRVRPALTAAANLTANDALPPVFQIVSTHANAFSITYSVSAHFTY